MWIFLYGIILQYLREVKQILRGILQYPRLSVYELPNISSLVSLDSSYGISLIT